MRREPTQPVDVYLALSPSASAPRWLRNIHDGDHAERTPGLRPLDGAGAGNVVRISEPNRLAAPPGVLKRAHPGKRARNLLHEARILSLLEHRGAQARGRVPRLLGLWRIEPASTLYMLSSTLTGVPLAELASAERPHPQALVAEIGHLLDAFQTLGLPTGRTNEGTAVHSWQRLARAELERYAGILTRHAHPRTADALRRFAEIPITEPVANRLVHRDLSPSNLVIGPDAHGRMTVRACDLGSAFLGPELWDLAGAELFLFPAHPDLRAPLRARFEAQAGTRCAEQVLCLAAWQLARLYAAAHRRGDAIATRRIVRALSAPGLGRTRASSACYRLAASLGNHLHTR